MGDMIPQSGLDPEFRAGHHKIDDVDLGTILAFTVGLVVLTTIVVAMLGIVMRLVHLGDDAEMARRPLLYEDAAGQYAGPRLEVDPSRNLPEFRARERARVESYDWIEPGKVARIPVSRAIEILAERGLPKAPEAPADDGGGEPTPTDAIRRARSAPLNPSSPATEPASPRPTSEPRTP
jgi:hypothetical protein